MRAIQGQDQNNGLSQDITEGKMKLGYHEYQHT